MSLPSARVEELFFAASRRRDPAERAAYLDEACGRGTDLRRRVEALLAAESRVAEFLESPAVTAPVEFVPEAGLSGVGTAIGPYQLVEPIGEGGMGVVYRAMQTAPVRREVALKIIKPGMDTKQVVARFEAERQALALMDHPNIARVLDGGATDSGRPYFVMELVRGIPITAYCDREQLPVRDRLELFVQVCRAVQHAHQKGIIHRDLKPSNILVADLDGTAVPKVIDFGVAKAIGQELTEKTLFTGVSQLIGTPLYMSPEQTGFSGADVDTRSDIYSLGALLYELLTGTTPFDAGRLRAAAYDELRRIIREEEPPRPGARLASLGDALATVAAGRRTDPRKLRRALRGELDWIVMRALEKDRRRRYDSAGSFAADVRHHLADRPVEARPPSTWYRFAKSARRHRVALATAATASLALIAGTAVSTWQAVRATQAEQQAEAARELAEEHRRLAERHVYALSLRQAQQAIELGQVERAQRILDEIWPAPDGTDPRGFAWHFLRRLARRQIVRIADRGGPIDRFALAPGGRELAYATRDGDLVLWDLIADRPRARLGRQALPPSELAFAPDGARLASVGCDWDRNASEVLIWDVPAGRLLTRLDQLGPGGIHGIRFTAGGRVLAIRKSSPDPPIDGTLFYDLGPDPCRPVPLRRFPYSGLSSPTPDGHVLVELARRRFTRRNLLTGAESWSISVPDVATLDIVPAPDGRQVAVAIEGREVLVLDAASGAVRDRLAVDGPHVAPLVGPGAATLAFPDPSRGVLVWDRKAGRSYRIDTKLAGLTAASVKAALSPDGSLLALAGRGSPGGQRPVAIHEVATGNIVATYPGRLDQVSDLAFAADGRSLFLRSGPTIQRWFFDGHGTDPVLAGHADEAWAVAFSPDGRILASGSDDTEPDDTIKLWDVAGGRILQAWRPGEGTISALAFSPDGRALASAALGPSENVCLWDVATRTPRAALAGHTDRVRSVAFSPDGRILASAGSDCTIRLWHVATGRPLRILSDHVDVVREVAFAPDGRTLASAANDRTVRLWDVGTGRVRRVFRGLEKYAAVRISPDGSLLAAADEGGSITLWDLPTGARVDTIHGEDAELFALAFSPDGRNVAAAGAGRVIRIWDVFTRQELLALRGHASQINGLAFSPDGRTLASCSHDGAVKLWRSGEPRPSP